MFKFTFEWVCGLAIRALIKRGVEPDEAEGMVAQGEGWLVDVKAAVWDEACAAVAEQGTVQIPDNPYRDVRNNVGT